MVVVGGGGGGGCQAEPPTTQMQYVGLQLNTIDTVACESEFLLYTVSTMFNCISKYWKFCMNPFVGEKLAQTSSMVQYRPNYKKIRQFPLVFFEYFVNPGRTDDVADGGDGGGVPGAGGAVGSFGQGGVGLELAGVTLGLGANGGGGRPGETINVLVQ